MPAPLTHACCPQDGVRLILVSSTNAAGDGILRYECPNADWFGPWFTGDPTGQLHALPEVTRSSYYVGKQGGGAGVDPVGIKDSVTPARTLTVSAAGAAKVDGSAVTQPVSGTFWQATQPVSGTFWQATQPVSGTFWQATQPVSGTFFQATQPVSGTVTADTELPAASALADADANPTTSRVGSNNLIWNGTTWDRTVEPTADSAASTGIPAAGLMVFNGTNWSRARAGVDNADGIITSGTAGKIHGLSFGLLFNGTTWDRARSGSTLGSVLVNNGVAANLLVTNTPPANQSVNLAQVAGTAASTGSRVTDAGVLSTFQAAPTAANILVGHQAFTATTAATTVIQVPVNRTWVGTITIVCDVANAAASAVAGQALGVVTTTGASVTPAAATVFSCEARAGTAAATSLDGTQQSTSASIPMVISSGASGFSTLALTSTQTGTNSRVACTCSGYLI